MHMVLRLRHQEQYDSMQRVGIALCTQLRIRFTAFFTHDLTEMVAVPT